MTRGVRNDYRDYRLVQGELRGAALHSHDLKSVRSAAEQIVDNALKSGNWTEQEPEFGEDEKRETVYIGVSFHLDPCGRYHNVLSPNIYAGEDGKDTEKQAEICSEFWEHLDSYASEKGLWLESGEGDPCDQYLGRRVETDEDEDNEETEEVNEPATAVA